MLNISALAEPLLPECLTGRLTYEDFNNDTAVKYEPHTWKYFQDRVIPEVVPGAVIGLISLAIFLALLAWFSVYYCNCCCRAACCKKAVTCKCCRGASTAPAAAAAELRAQAPQDIKGENEAPFQALSPIAGMNLDAAHAGAQESAAATEVTAIPILDTCAAAEAVDSPKPPPELGHARLEEDKQARRRYTINLVEKALIALFVVATIATSIWGIAASLRKTDSQIEAAWELVQNVEYLVDNTTQGLSQVGRGLDTLRLSMNVLSGNDLPVVGVLSRFVNATDSGVLSTGIGALTAAAAKVEAVNAAIDNARYSLETYLGGTIDDLRADYEPPSLAFQNRWRIGLIVLIFIVLMLTTILAGVFTYMMDAENHWPKLATGSVLVLWFATFLLFLLGSGVIKGLAQLTKDTCLYLETYVLSMIEQRIKDPLKRAFLLIAIKFYIDPTPAEADAGFGSALRNITGLELKDIVAMVKNPAVQKVVTVFNNPLVQRIMATDVGDGINNALKEVSQLVPPLQTTLTKIDVLSLRSNIMRLHSDVKSLVCCDGWNAAEDLALAWTVCGSMAFILGVLCIWRLMRLKYRGQ